MSEVTRAPPAALEDERSRQSLRLRRYLMGAGTSLLVAASLFIWHGFDLLPLNIAIGGAALIGFFIVLFYGMFRSGLNLRFRDPSLTSEMIVAAVMTLAYLMYHAAPARDALSLFYPVALLFGVLRLGTARLLALALIALAAHAAVLASTGGLQGAGARASWLQLAALAIVLPWFAVMGGYVNQLRQRLSGSNRQLKKAAERAEEHAIRDVLTGVHNRRYLMTMLQREIARSTRRGAPLSVCMIDMDHFKTINDTHGHAAGDLALKHFAVLASSGLRAGDVFGRFGGEEFMLILPDTEASGAAALAERLRASVEKCDFPGLPAQHRVTVTVGIAAYTKGESGDALTARADGALYRGKHAGRNRIVVLGVESPG
ncbi:MAG: GGDEF domain-containing protein [Betaproteobacteria bacterium]|nr:GGDEF domain-containing protein [Betaproteobacteria bacterium]